MIKTEEEYYNGIYLTRYNRYQIHNNNNEYLGYVQKLTDALYYRDLYGDKDSKTAPRPSEVDLRKDNPYRQGLKYPVPERLQKEKNRTRRQYGKGTIKKASKQAYKISYSGEYYCTCRTYEQAYYVRQELIKCNWDKNQLQHILDEYPKWYTWLMYFYEYISRDRTKDIYIITFPRKINNGRLERLYYNELTDALWERDFLVEHNWDYDLLVETIDDTQNIYENMELPPYPTRKIRYIRKKNRNDEKFQQLIEVLQEDINLHQGEAAKRLGVSTQTIRKWLQKYNTDWLDIKTKIQNNPNPLECFQIKEVIYQPDLSIKKNHTNIAVDKNRRNKYRVFKNRVYYGDYPTRKIASKIVQELEKVNWDKKQLPYIQKKCGVKKRVNRKNVYPNKYGYEVRKKKNGKIINYGSYKEYALASIVRNLLEHNNWDKNKLPMIKENAEYIHRVKNEIRYKYNMNNWIGVIIL